MDMLDKALKLHSEKQGKIEVLSKVKVDNNHDLSLAYTPGVAEPCKLINKNADDVYKYTSKGNLVAILTDGTAVLGLGDIGPEAAMPVMEGKAVLFKSFAGVDAFPICLGTTDIDEIVKTVKYLEPTFGGINIEDIKAPACFEIEKRLKEELSIPVFHDDQHGTAIVVLGAFMNAVKLVNKNPKNVKVTINGAGSASIAVAKLLIAKGVNNILVCDRKGIIYKGRTEGMNKYKEEIAKITNKNNIKGSLNEGIKDADVFIGLSVGNTVTKEMVESMANDPIVFAMANPIPEIMPEDSKAAGAKIIATGRSDFPNQINNVLAFPGVFRGALDVRAKDINEEMKIAAAEAIAKLAEDDGLNKEYIITGPFDKRVAFNVAVSTAKAAIETGIAKNKIDILEYEQKLLRSL